MIRLAIARTGCARLACLLPALALYAAAEDDFRWSWEKGGAAEPPPATGSTVFAWGWQADATAQPTAAPATAPAATPATTTATASAPGSVDASAYNDLLRENLDLRRKLTDAGDGEAKLARENQRLMAETKGLEDQISKLVLSIQELKQKGSDGTGARDLEAKLAAAEAEKERLRESLASLSRGAEERRRADAAVQTPAPPSSSPVEPGSDLFRRLEKENMELRQNLARLEAENKKAGDAQARIAGEEARARENVDAISRREQELRKELAASKELAEKSRDMAERLPKIESDLASLTQDVRAKSAALAEKERQIAELREELRRRETRAVTAEKTVALADQAGREIQAAAEREKRDMHYNMGVMYARDGKYRNAEQEYLKALRIDPADADSHYNLGILYDEGLGDKSKAAVHYRRFLMLKPHGPDADAVKGWLMAIEVRR